MTTFALPGYAGPTLPSEVTSFLAILTSHGFTTEATSDQAGKTIRIFHHGVWYGYINGSVLERSAVLGYRFTAWDHNNNACPPEVADHLASTFAEKYACTEDDVIVQRGKGGNSGRAFLIVRNPTVALRVLQIDTAQPIDVDIQIIKFQGTFVEGATRDVVMQRMERSSAARQACLQHYGYACSACGRKLRELYRGLTSDLIHVHHEEPLAGTTGPREVNPITDMKPVCPNCHAVIHSRTPAYTIEEVTRMYAGEA